MVKIPENASFTETYGQALKVKTSSEAQAWINGLIISYRTKTGASREEALKHIRRNLWNFACHMSDEAMITAEKFYGCCR